MKKKETFKIKPLFFIMDENINVDELTKSDHFIHIIRNKEIKDKKIIELTRIIANPLVLITKNYKDFKSKLKSNDRILKISDKLTQNMLDQFLPKAKEKIVKATGLKKCKLITLAQNNSGEPHLIAKSESSTKFIKLSTSTSKI